MYLCVCVHILKSMGKGVKKRCLVYKKWPSNVNDNGGQINLGHIYKLNSIAIVRNM